MGRAVKIVVLLILVLVLLIEIARYNLAAPEEVIGSWEYSRGPRRSCIDVHADGTYKHIIENQGQLELESSAKWTIDNPTQVSFEKFQHLSDNGDSIKRPVFWILMPYRTILLTKAELRLSFDEDLLYQKRKTSCEGTNGV
jgi:hypothetical protein